MSFFFEVLIGGLLAGVMYSLVALGFVLIYKASGVFNFAQGSMVLFAALTYVGMQEKFGFPFWLAFLVALAVMVVVGVLTERIVLRPLVNQPQISLFMATIGLAFFLEGLSQLIWGTGVHPLSLGITDEPIESLLTQFNIVVSKFDVAAAIVAGVLVAVLAIFFNRTRIGRALRAVADDHQAALAVGIPLQ
ncbi:MAG: branched-chain amino acid ABC transporter permease, partial [Betaproteobacteria bacterium]